MLRGYLNKNCIILSKWRGDICVKKLLPGLKREGCSTETGYPSLLTDTTVTIVFVPIFCKMMNNTEKIQIT